MSYSCSTLTKWISRASSALEFSLGQERYRRFIELCRRGIGWILYVSVMEIVAIVTFMIAEFSSGQPSGSAAVVVHTAIAIIGMIAFVVEEIFDLYAIFMSRLWRIRSELDRIKSEPLPPTQEDRQPQVPRALAAVDIRTRVSRATFESKPRRCKKR